MLAALVMILALGFCAPQPALARSTDPVLPNPVVSPGYAEFIQASGGTDLQGTDEVDVLWTPVGSTLTGTGASGAGVLGNYMYLFGSVMANSAYALDLTPIPPTWVNSTPAPLGRDDWCGVATSSAIYLIGRHDASTLPNYGAEVQKFTPIGAGPLGNWVNVAPYPYGPACGIAAAWDGRGCIYTAGGFNGTATIFNAYKYCIGTDTWTAIANLPVATRYAGGAFVGGRFYVVGGTTTPNSLYEYNPCSDTWALRANLPTAVSSATFSTTFNQCNIFLVGGGTNAVQIYYPSLNLWNTTTPLPVARLNNSARYTFEGKVISTGGYEFGVGYSAVTYQGIDFPYTKLFVFPSSLCFTWAGTIWDYPQHLTIYNTGTAALNWTVTDNINWLLESPMAGGPLASGAATLIHCFLDSTLMIMPGTYLGHVTVAAVGDSGIPISACLIRSETSLALSIGIDQPGPWIIPPGGSSFDYYIRIRNNTGVPQTLDVWTKLQLPDCAWRPVFGPFINLTIPGWGVINRTRPVVVVDRMMPGIVRLQGSVGTYPNIEMDTHSIWGMKLPWPTPPLGEENPIGADLWFCDNEPFFDEELVVDEMQPSSCSLQSCAPNPFNPSTVVSFELRDVSYVSLKVYDTSGRLVAELVNGWRDAGDHQITFDGSGLPSGIYFAKLTAGDYSQVQKMMLMK
jgi:hypothetical protein